MIEPSRTVVPFGPRQHQVHELIEAVGGYWRPSAGVTRILEELGELSEEIEAWREGAGLEGLENELADLWIITSAVANLFGVVAVEREDERSQVRGEPRSLEGQRSPVDIGRLLQHAGRIARIVNYYDGPKTPRSFEGWQPISSAIVEFQRELFRVAAIFGIDLGAAIERKVGRTKVVDRARFRRGFNPAMASCLVRFSALIEKSLCIFANQARLWGAPDWDTAKTTSFNIDAAMPYLVMFAKAAPQEDLDGFLMQVPSPRGQTFIDGMARRLRELLVGLANRDPGTNRTFLNRVDVPGWQFEFNGLRMFVMVFSDGYPIDHLRYCDEGSFVLFQPERSFDSFGIGHDYRDSARRKAAIRSRFTNAGMSYPTHLIDERVEAALYLLPTEADSQEPVAWWLPKYRSIEPALF